MAFQALPSAPLSSQDASSLHTSNLWVTLEPKLFLPNSIYVARVRTQLAPGSSLSGRPSRWSPEVHWDSPTGNGAGRKCPY